MQRFQSSMTFGRKTRLNSQQRDLLYLKGLEAFNTEHFYEAHEHWEEVWLETSDPDKKFLQGLIQVAAAFHHHSRANLLGTHNLLREGLRKLDEFPSRHGGLEIAELREEVRGWLTALAEASETGKFSLPKIRVPRGARPTI